VGSGPLPRPQRGDTDAQGLGLYVRGGVAVPNPRAVMHGGPCVVVLGNGTLLRGERSGPAERWGIVRIRVHKSMTLDLNLSQHEEHAYS